MNKKILVLLLALSLTLVACDKKNPDEIVDEPVKSTEAKPTEETNTTTTPTEEVKDNNTNNENTNNYSIDFSSIIADMNSEFLTSDNYGEIRDFSIDVDNNIFSVLITVEEGVSQGSAEGLYNKVESKLNSLFLSQNLDLNKYTVNYKIIEDSTNNILFTK